jgi:hypothetical protein
MVFVERWIGATCAVMVAAGCATSQPVPKPGVGTEHVVSCWYFGWYLCYEKAKEICQGDYKVVSQSDGAMGRELRITCSG